MFTIIFVCPTDRLPTHYRQVANRSPTVGRQSANTLASNITQTVGRLSADSRPIVGRLSADCWSTVGQLLADSRPTVGRQFADCRPTVGRQYILGTILHYYQPEHFSQLKLTRTSPIMIFKEINIQFFNLEDNVLMLQTSLSVT